VRSTWRSSRELHRTIHRSAWKGNSANFGLTEFSEVTEKFTDGVIMPRMVWRMLVLAALVFANQRRVGSS
jgi:hypothetical protein